jgi:hypothetical protein
MFTCPVCFYDKMPDPPAEYNICPCCGTEFENDDEFRTHTELRNYWIARGARWFFHTPPFLWNPWEQLARANVELPYHVGVSFAGARNFYQVDPCAYVVDRADQLTCVKDNLAVAA